VSRKLRVGIVGSGFGGTVHVPAFAAQGRFEVVALASPSHAAAIAAERNVPHAFATVEELLASERIDVLSVASPPFAHRAAVLAGLARGLHVLCEKPFGLNVAEAAEMTAAAASAGSVCALAHEFRYTPPFQAIKELIANEHLGALRALEVSWYSQMLRAREGRANSWWFERRRGGGISGAILSHLVDGATWLAGRTPLRATGYERTAVPQRTAEGATFTSDVADGAFATIDYGGGLIATVTADAARVVEGATVAAHGGDRTAVASGPHILSLTTFVVDSDETSELELKPQEHANLGAAHPNIPPFVTLLDQFAAAIDGKPASLPTFAEGLATQRVLEAIGYTTPSIGA